MKCIENKKLILRTAGVLVLTVPVWGLAACSDDSNTAEDVGEQIDDAADDVGDAIDDAADEVEDVIDD